MQLRTLSILLLICSSFTVCSQVSVSLDYKKKKLVNWSTSSKVRVNESFFPKDTSLLIDGENDFCMKTKETFSSSKEIICTFEFLLFIESRTIGEKIGSIGIDYEFTNENGRIDRYNFFRSDSLMIDALLPGKWCRISKSIYLSNLKNISLIFHYESLAFQNSRFYIKDLNLKMETTDDFFKNNLVLNGSFEVNNVEPKNYNEGFDYVPFWENNIYYDCITTRESLLKDINQKKDRDRANAVFDMLSKGNPDLTSSFIYESYEGDTLKFGKYCAKLRLPNFKFIKNRGGEYLQTKLSQTLLKDSVYELSLYLKVSSNSPFTVSNFGARFSDCALYIYDPFFYKGQLPKSDLFFTNEFIEVSEGWKEFKIIYKALGNEKYLTIGCFDNGFDRDTNKMINMSLRKNEKFPVVYIDSIRLIGIPGHRPAP
jgi:hypothetical protein